MTDPVFPPGTERALPPDDLGFLRAFLREVCYSSPEVRALYAEAMSRMRRHCFAALSEAPTEDAARIAAQLSVDGIADLGSLIEPPRAADMLAYFRTRPVLAGHEPGVTDGQERDLAATRLISHYGCYGAADVLRCPHVLEIANDARILQAVEAYLGCPPTIYHVNAWWSFAHGGTAARWSQSLHRDLDELRFVTMFIYLTPVDERTGAHRYIKHSHDKAQLARALTAAGWQPSAIETAAQALFCGTGYAMSGTADDLLGHLAKVWQGPAGSAVLADTYGLHMGIPLVEGERLMLWVRYGLGFPHEPAFGGGAGRYAATIAPRIPQTARARYVNRLLLTD